MLNVHWVKCNGDVWCGLHTVDLSKITAAGVYVIWHGGSPGRYVYVGQGDVASRLTSHRQNPEIAKYRSNGLYVTWAAVPANQRDGVERYLADKLAPLVGDAHPDCAPIAVNW